MLIKYIWVDYFYYNIFYLCLFYIFDIIWVVYCFCCKCFVVVFLYDIFLESLYWVNEKKIEEYLLMLFLVYILGFVLLYLNEN